MRGGALRLLYRCLLHELLSLVVQIATLGARGFGHCPEQRRRCDELLACAFQSQRIFNVVVVVDAGLSQSSGLSNLISEAPSISVETDAEILSCMLVLGELGLQFSQLSPLRIFQLMLVISPRWVNLR